MTSAQATRQASQWLTIDDVAEHFRVPLATVRDWRARGRGPQGVRIGRHVRYRPEAVEAWARQLEAEQAADRDPEAPDLAAPVRPVSR